MTFEKSRFWPDNSTEDKKLLRLIYRPTLALAVICFTVISWTGGIGLDTRVEPAPGPRPTASNTTTHKVSKGENDWTIAEKYGITVIQLHHLNPDVKWNKLQLGQKIVVPAPEKPKPVAKKTVSKKAVAQTSKPKVTTASVKTTGQTAKVAKTDVILRSGPNTDSDRVAKLNKGQTAVVLERRNGWTKVRFGSGTTGWLRDDLVTVTGTVKSPELVAKNGGTALPETPAAGTAKPAVGDPKPVDSKPVETGTVGTEPVDLGSNKAGADSKADEGGPAKVIVAPPLPPAIDPNLKNAFDDKVAKITASNVIVRSGPSTSNDRIVMVSKGRVAELLAKQDDWYKVKFSGGTIGWIRGDLLSLVARSEAGNDGAAPEDTVALDPDATKVDKAIATAKSKLGTRYVYGASRSSAFDCSGFVLWVMNKHGIDLPRTAAQQAGVGTKVSRASLKAGDLVFFRTTRGPRISHVGIYIGNGKFIHASSGGGQVQINSLSDAYYSKRFATARRLPGLAK